MTKPRTTAMAVAAASGAAAASPEHKRFQTLMARSERARARLAAWQRELPAFARLHAERVMPARRAFTALRREWAFELEQVLTRQRWARADGQTLVDLVAATALAALQDQADFGDPPDEALEALYNRHVEVPLDAEDDPDEVAAVQAAIEELTGLQFDPDAPPASMEEVLRQTQEQMAAAAAQQAERDAAREARRAERRTKNPTPAQRKAAEAERQVSQTVREVYRKLAGALHPDRVGAGASDADRALATERMQRANAAYEAGDLLALLELQLQIEQVDVEHVATIAAAQVKHFNKVLGEQVRELEREVDEREFHFMRSYGLETQRRLDPAQLHKLIGEELSALEGAKRRIAYDRRTLSGPPAGVRRFLKAWRDEQRFREQLMGMRMPF